MNQALPCSLFRIFSFCLFFTFAIHPQLFSQSLPAKRNHEITLDSAKTLISNHKNDTVQMKVKGGMFFREVFEKILDAKNVAAVRYYYAKTNDGTPTLVLVGVDTVGNDITTAAIAEKSYPCPPYCDESSPLVK